jgi:hypothetical protein
VFRRRIPVQALGRLPVSMLACRFLQGPRQWRRGAGLDMWHSIDRVCLHKAMPQHTRSSAAR